MKEQSVDARATREGSKRVQLGEVVAGLGPCGPHSGRPCGKQGRERLQHRKGIDSTGVGRGGWCWAEEKQVPGSVGTPQTDLSPVPLVPSFLH